MDVPLYDQKLGATVYFPAGLKDTTFNMDIQNIRFMLLRLSLL